MQKYYTQNTLQRVYAWVGFVVVWVVVLTLVGFIAWSMIEQDKAINLLVNIFS